ETGTLWIRRADEGSLPTSTTGETEAPRGDRRDRRSQRFEAVLRRYAVGRAVLTITNHAVNASERAARHVLDEQIVCGSNDDRPSHRRSFLLLQDCCCSGPGGAGQRLLRVGNRTAEDGA